ncbi:phosphoribosylaminoimidazolesuccinocarboxamide synthase [Enterococcus sp. 8G7_MSG3316]|uniref:Phosphoribosylaminoimidazole-succinocarboxamide synthase n=1 Tax=Candidatus Enterococcus testudinis TaxID=1834191 RepID=A0A242A6M0_9ENTE|nr:phosphoribosylaminoimidazolesuccinocarboxamide synthase [Enterococcus sp. 8G7_MSG3316]OTN76687.1 phosphoribosylaminoimidazolesuccinocarboxamide synthase [Enterococcus sp. 8G7_MSG3316]
METEVLLYEGKAKKLFKKPDSKELRVEYLDQATALNGQKKDAIQGKGALNNQITSILFQLLAQEGIQSHFIKIISKHEQLIEMVDMIPLEVVVRNVAAGSFSKRLGIEEGTTLPQPIVEFYYKDDALDDPFINDDHIAYLGLATEAERQQLRTLALTVNRALQHIFAQIDIRLIDFKIEIGKTAQGHLLLADEISPDTCRLWDMATNNHLDKDIYRRDLGDILPVYQEVYNRLEKEFSSCI